MSPDIQAALHAALARAQAQHIQPAPSRVQHVAEIQQIAKSLASHLASRRMPLGKAQVAHPYIPPGVATTSDPTNPYGVSYAPDGIPAHWMPGGSTAATGDYGMFVRRAPNYLAPGAHPVNGVPYVG